MQRSLPWFKVPREMISVFSECETCRLLRRREGAAGQFFDVRLNGSHGGIRAGEFEDHLAICGFDDDTGHGVAFFGSAFLGSSAAGHEGALEGDEESLLVPEGHFLLFSFGGTSVLSAL